MKPRFTPVLSMALLMLAASAQQPYPFQFDVPYACPDGSTYVMLKCVTGAKGEFCSFLRDNNPQYSTRADMTTRMSRCTIKGGGSPTTPPPASAAAGLQENTPYQCAGALTVTAFECQRQAGQEYCFVKLQQNGKFLAQLAKPRDEIAAKVKSCQAGAPFNPPYLSEFPSPDRVVAAMRAGGARDNVLRAIGAFYQLDEIINALAGDRASGSYLPDERKFLDQYRAAITEMQKAAEKAFPAERFDVTSNPYHFSRSDPKFGFEGIPVWVTLLSPTVQARFAQTVGASDARYLAAVEQEKRAAIQRANADLQAAQAQARMPRDQGSVAARKCIESGRSEMECLGEGLKIGVNELTGNALTGLTGGAAPTGLRMGGVYTGGGFNIDFDLASASVACRTLIPQPLSYIIDRTGDHFVIRIPTSPKPLALSLRSDGKLGGPGPIDIAGRIVVGTTGGGPAGPAYEAQTHTTTQERQIDAAQARNYEGTDAVHRNGMDYSVTEQTTTTTYEPTTPHYSAPITAPKTERCDASVLSPAGPSARVSDVLTQSIGSDPGSVARPSPGLRLSGTYAGPGALRIEFRADSATLECGEAHVAAAYAVRDSGGQVSIAVHNSSARFVLALRSDGTLTGSGAVQVNGRIATGKNGTEIVYVPRTATCTLGTLSPLRAAR